MSEYQFKEGDKAVCVSSCKHYGKPLIEKGCVHTVKYVNWAQYGPHRGQILAFAGVGNEDLESSYPASDFELYVEEDGVIQKAPAGDYPFKKGDTVRVLDTQIGEDRKVYFAGDEAVVSDVMTSEGMLWLCLEGEPEGLDYAFLSGHFQLVEPKNWSNLTEADVDTVMGKDKELKFMPDDDVWSIADITLERMMTSSVMQDPYLDRQYYGPDFPFRIEVYFPEEDEVKLSGYDNRIPADKFELVRRGSVVVDVRPERPFKVGDFISAKVGFEGFEGAFYCERSDFKVTEVGPDGMLMLSSVKGYVHPNLVQLREPAKPNEQSVQLGRIADALETLVRSK